VLASLPAAFVAPGASGSGISEVKAVLNGLKLPQILRFKTLVCKVFGNIFAVASGLPVGKEGPMIHSGAIVAAGLSQGKSTTLGVDTKWSFYRAFRDDKEKRDFIACGAASGVAAAFGAPIGGVLFAIEEGASHWYRGLVWRIFFTSVTTAYVLDIFMSAVNSAFGRLSSPGMFSFGSFDLTGQTLRSYRIYEVPLFMLIGCVGGGIGAVFSFINNRATRLRFSCVPANKPWKRLAEAVLLAVLVCVVSFLAVYYQGRCVPLPASMVPDVSPARHAPSIPAAGPSPSANPVVSPSPPPSPSADLPSYADALIQLYCPDGQYNNLASLFLAPPEDAIKLLFHQPDAIPLPTLLLFWFVYTAFACVVFGIAVPSGIFIPALLSGATLGRISWHVLTSIIPDAALVGPGVYSLVGAAAVLGGVTRMTISLAVILVECSATYQFGLPLMVALLPARFVGNLFNEGVYDLHIHLRNWPVLPDSLSKELSRPLRVCDIMACPPLAFREVEKVGVVLDVLRACRHNGFPVVYSDRALTAHGRLGSLAGLILRKHLSVLLAKRAFHRDLPSVPLDSIALARNPVAYAAFTANTKSVLPPAGASGLGTIDLQSLGPHDVSRVHRRWNSPGKSALSGSSGYAGLGQGTTAIPIPSSPVPLRHRGATTTIAASPESAVLGESLSSDHEALSSVVTASDFAATVRARGGSSVVGGRTGEEGDKDAPLPELGEQQYGEMIRASSSSSGIRPGMKMHLPAALTRSPRLSVRKGPNTGSFFIPAQSAPSSAAASRMASRAASFDDPTAAAVVGQNDVLTSLPLSSVSDSASAETEKVGGVFFIQAGARRRGRGGSGKQRDIVLSNGVKSTIARESSPQPTSEDEYSDTSDVEDTPQRATLVNDISEYVYPDEPLLNHLDFARFYPRYPDVHELDISPEEREMWIDLRPYMDASPTVVSLHTPSARAFAIFARLGLRHLCVINDAADVVGILTRHDFTEKHLKRCIARKLDPIS
jgi:chloride channel 7